MDIPTHRKWMANRLHVGRITQEFIRGVDEFDAFARRQHVYQTEGRYRCPCCKCKNRKFLMPEDVKVHLYRAGFMHAYWYWISHGEVEPDVGVNLHQGSSSVVDDNLGTRQEHEIEPPNVNGERLDEKFNAAKRPLYPGCSHTELSFALRVMSFKCDHNMSRRCCDEWLQFMKELLPPNNLVPSKFSELDKFLKNLGVSFTITDSSSETEDGGDYTSTDGANFSKENKKQKIELGNHKKALENMQANMKMHQVRGKKLSKKVKKYAQATQDMQAQMTEWHSVLKTVHPTLPTPKLALDSSNESEDDSEDDDDDEGWDE